MPLSGAIANSLPLYLIVFPGQSIRQHLRHAAAMLRSLLMLHPG